MDRRVLDVPLLQRAALVYLVIVPRRAHRSAEAYRKIWTAEGSPLLCHVRELARKLEARAGAELHVEPAMRYGEPAIPAALARLQERGCRRIVVFPLYPHWSGAATGSALAATFAAAAKSSRVPALQVVPPYFDHPAYLDARAELARPLLETMRPERVFFTFHGVPERQLRRERPECLSTADCCTPLRGDCALLRGGNRGCYRAQCLRTAELLAARLGLDAERWQVCFQSRLGRSPWAQPYADSVLEAAARSGVRRAVVWSSFVADCLETLEELGMRAAADWRRWGGEQLSLLPAPNSHELWVEAVLRIARDACGPLGGEAAARAAS